MPEIEMTPTRQDYLEFSDYLAEHPQPEPIQIPLAALYELAERAQIRAQVVKEIVAETESIEEETAMIDWKQIYENCRPIDHQLDGLRLDIARGLERAAIDAKALPIMEHAKRVLISSSVVLVGFLALIWTVVHFAQKAGPPW